jgi:hypothetical protein
MASPFEHPEAREHFSKLLVSLTAESDRGAIVIGAAVVDKMPRSWRSTSAQRAALAFAR